LESEYRGLGAARVAPFQHDLVEIFSVFGTVCGGVMLLTFLLTFLRGSPLSSWSRFKAVWLVLSGCIHMFLEGYYVINAQAISVMDTLRADMWKEYAKADSRYLIMDPPTLTLEAITSFLVGPLCVLAALGIVVRNKGLDLILSIVVSVAHLYGCGIYFATEWLDAFNHVRTDKAYYWGFYFTGMNGVWVVLPAIILLDNIVQAIKLVNRGVSKPSYSKTKEA